MAGSRNRSAREQARFAFVKGGKEFSNDKTIHNGCSHRAGPAVIACHVIGSKQRWRRHRWKCRRRRCRRCGGGGGPRERPPPRAPRPPPGPARGGRPPRGGRRGRGGGGGG